MGFLQQDLWLNGSPLARELFQNHALSMPIVDFHNHLSPQQMAEDVHYENLGHAWLGGDHYKWRAMRMLGIEERLITGNASWEEKFHAWAGCLPQLIGSPLYVWTHLELQRYFHIDEPLNEKNAAKIYEKASTLLQEPDYGMRSLLQKMNVEVLYTTDDPADPLDYHEALASSDFSVKVCPAFRPDKVLSPDKPEFAAYLQRLGKAAEKEIHALKDLQDALLIRLDAFVKAGCRASDHALEEDIYLAGTEAQAQAVLEKALRGETIGTEEKRIYRGWLLRFLAEAYAERDLVMQLHLGALRNNNRRMFKMLGPDTGFDSIDDIHYIQQLSALLSDLDEESHLPKTILYCMSSKDYEMLCTMAGNFQQAGVRGKVQLGAAWWFLDQRDGIRRQMETLSQMGVLSTFVGMLTDSRSFLSFPRHEYFRRLLCEHLAAIVERGEYPPDREWLGKIVEDICYYNAKTFFKA